MKQNALEMAGLVSELERPKRSAATKPGSRAGWLVLGSIVLVVTAVASPLTAGADEFSSCRDANGASTTHAGCGDSTDGTAAASTPRDDR